PHQSWEERIMDNSQNRKITGKVIALVIIIAIVTSVAVTLIQQLLVGASNTAVTGGVVGAVTALMAIRVMRKSAASE
ncbi:MAG: hypothetical protein ACREBD_35540, partial [Blastocatellia bacterium]